MCTGGDCGGVGSSRSSRGADDVSGVSRCVSRDTSIVDEMLVFGWDG